MRPKLVVELADGVDLCPHHKSVNIWASYQYCKSGVCNTTHKAV